MVSKITRHNSLKTQMFYPYFRHLKGLGQIGALLVKGSTVTVNLLRETLSNAIRQTSKCRA